ncbi:MAG: glycoside hydrolase family 76 protein [Verrucomicrobiota bacterium]|nr:glycoside hydrolase family 76 protein [Verrucomicrobiota bacterium]
MRNEILALLASLTIPVCGQGAVVPGDDFNANTATAVLALQRWYDTTNGLWNTTGWWNSANCVDALEDDIAANDDTNYLATLQNTFSLNSGGHFLNYYYDDEGWWANAWIRAYDLTGNAAYLNMAKTMFADLTNGWDGHCNGGLWWSKARTYKNAIPNELFLLTAIRLHQRTPGDGGPGTYFYWATNEWAWFRASGMINGFNLINDGLTSNCLNNGETTWTYNQGVILGGLTDLYKATGNANYLSQAEAIANASISHLVSGNGVLQEPCDCGGGDVPEFKGIFIRNLAYLYDEDHRPAYFNFLFNNAHAVWFSDRNSSNQLGMLWTGPFDAADAARQSSAIMPLSVVAEPVTALLPFAKGSGDPAFNHAVGGPVGTLAWSCGAATPAGWMQSGPYLASLPPGGHVVHFRMAVSATSNSASNLVSLAVIQNGNVLAGREAPWSSFEAAGQPQDFQLPFTNTVAGGVLEFRVFWHAVTDAPVLTLSDVTVDGSHNWAAVNLAHDVGRFDGNNNWEADPVRDQASGYLVSGPGTAELPAGACAAEFELKVDNFNWDNTIVATLSVVDTDSGRVLASRDVARSEFPNALYHNFDVYFQAAAGAHYDFRTYWHYAGTAPRLTQRSVVVRSASGSRFVPIALTPGGYNQDMVIERIAPHPPASNTTASMDAGAVNTGNSWYEQGYDAAAPATGLPPPGSTLTDPSSTDHAYTLAPSYTANNVAMVDASHGADLVPANLDAFSALSFLTASGHGPAVVDYRVEHADSSAESGAFSSPDWFFNMPVVFNAQGRVDVVTGAFNSVNNNNPRLYAEDIALTNIASPVTNIHLGWDTGSHPGSVAAIFAVSGVAVPPAPLGIAVSGGQVVLTWPFGQLLEATNLTGPWFTNAAAQSPYEAVPGGSVEFYRLETQ